MKEAWKPVYPLFCSLFLAPSLSFIPTASSHSSQYTEITWRTFSICLLFFIHKDFHSGGPKGYFSFFFFFFASLFCWSSKEEQGLITFLKETLWRVSSSQHFFFSSTPLFCFTTLLWGRMSRTHYGACVVLWIFSLVECKVPGKINFYCDFWHFF